MPIPKGAHYTDRTRHNVAMPDGRIVSRATAENEFARNAGFRTNYELKQASVTARGAGLFGSARYARDLAEAKARGTSEPEFRALAAKLHAAPRDARGAPTDRSPDGPLARFLTAIGRRSPRADYSVGETPTVM